MTVSFKEKEDLAKGLLSITDEYCFFVALVERFVA